MKTFDPLVVEFAGYAKFDFVIFDKEHIAVQLLHMQIVIRAIEVTGITASIRLRNQIPDTVSQVFDSFT